MGAVCHRVPASARLPAARVGDCDAVDGPDRRDELFPPERPGREWRGSADQRRWQSPVVAAPLLVPRASRGLRADSSRHGHCRGDHREQHPQAALGLQVPRPGHARAGIPFLRRLGPPYVANRHGHGGERVFSDDDDDHLDPVGHHFKRVFHLAVGRVDSVHGADAFRDGFPADVRDRRPDGHSAGV